MRVVCKDQYENVDRLFWCWKVYSQIILGGHYSPNENGIVINCPNKNGKPVTLRACLLPGAYFLWQHPMMTPSTSHNTSAVLFLSFLWSTPMTPTNESEFDEKVCRLLSAVCCDKMRIDNPISKVLLPILQICIDTLLSYYFRYSQEWLHLCHR